MSSGEKPQINPEKIFIYGRSLGGAVGKQTLLKYNYIAFVEKFLFFF